MTEQQAALAGARAGLKRMEEEEAAIRSRQFPARPFHGNATVRECNRLSEKFLDHEDARIERAYAEDTAGPEPHAYTKTYALQDELCAVCCTLVMPLGELLNPDLAGALLVWKMLGRISDPVPMPPGLSAQGIEGAFAVVACDLHEALFTRRTVGPFRIAVYRAA